MSADAIDAIARIMSESRCRGKFRGLRRIAMGPRRLASRGSPALRKRGGRTHCPGRRQSRNEIVDTLNRQGHKFSFKQVPKEVFATSFPGAAEMAATFAYFQAHTYLGSDSSDRIALANKIAGRQPTKFSTWARVNFPSSSATR